MSALTDEVKDRHSPVAAWLATTFPRCTEIQTRFRVGAGAQRVPLPAGVAPGTQGSAIDFWLRMLIDPQPSIALPRAGLRKGRASCVPAGKELLDELAGGASGSGERSSGELRTRPAAFAGREDSWWARVCYALALLTELYRFTATVGGSRLTRLDVRSRATDLLELATDAEVADLIALRDLAREQLLPALPPGPVTTGMTFDGSADLAVDADLIAGGMLVDLKAGQGRPRADGTRAASLARTDLDQVLGYALMDWRQARPHFDTALALFTQLYDTASIADATCNLAGLDRRLADLDAAERRYERARDLYVGIQAWWHVATVEQYLGNVAYHRGDLHRARWYYTRARLGLRAIARDPTDVADIDVNFAGLSAELGDHTHALELLDEAAALYGSVLDGDDLATKLAELDQNRGIAHMAAGDLPAAWSCLSRALVARRREDLRKQAADLVHDLANVARRLGWSITAIALYELAISTYEEFADDRAQIADCRLGQRAVLWREGDVEGARSELQAAADSCRTTGNWLALAQATHNVALTWPDDSPEKIDTLVPAWLAMQSVTWGLPEASARNNWNGTFDDCSDATLAGPRPWRRPARRRARRSDALGTSASTTPLPAGISLSGTTVHDLPVVRPAAVDCGCAPALLT